MKKTILMSEIRSGSPDGIAVNRYLEGETYTVPESLADVFLEQGWATETSEPEPAPEEPTTNPYDSLSDEDLAQAVLENDTDADPGKVAEAIAADRAAVIAHLTGTAGTDADGSEPNPSTPAEKPLDEMNMAELRDVAQKAGVPADELKKLSRIGTSKKKVIAAIDAAKAAN